MKRFTVSVVALALMIYLIRVDGGVAQEKSQNEVRVQKQSSNVRAVQAGGKGTEQAAKNARPVRHGRGFVDANGDGYNDNAPDADGDGIPNGLDPDYTGPKIRAGRGARGFVDLDGDGINDNAMDADGDGIPNGRDPDYVRPADGTGTRRAFGRAGYGKAVNPGMLGTGTCKGTGPKGQMGRKGRSK
jgi:hypothetical protein